MICILLIILHLILDFNAHYLSSIQWKLPGRSYIGKENNFSFLIYMHLQTATSPLVADLWEHQTFVYWKLSLNSFEWLSAEKTICRIVQTCKLQNSARSHSSVEVSRREKIVKNFKLVTGALVKFFSLAFYS